MNGVRVLLASADATLRQTLELACRERDYEHVVAESDEQLHEAQSSLHPALIVVDLDGAGRDGVRMLRGLAERHCLAPVVLAGSCDVRTLAAAQRVGSKQGLRMGAPLHKPVDARRAGRCLLEALSIHDHVITPDDLRRGLERDEFDLHYQPLVDLHSECVHGCEVLLRWDHPVYGRLDPSKVIPVAEKHGLIAPLTEWIVRHALQQYARWSRQGWSFRIAINVAAEGLRDAAFADRLVQIVHATGVAPDRLILEVTESQTITEEVEVLETLTRLRLAGIELAIDDFGTGYSSLGRLHQLPFTELKIDKSFVMDAEQDPNCEVIVRAISELGHQLGMLVVAEGVATREAWDFVSGLKCDVAQGYFVSRPLPADDFTAWLYRWGVTHGVGAHELSDVGRPRGVPRHADAEPEPSPNGHAADDAQQNGFDDAHDLDDHESDDADRTAEPPPAPRAPGHGLPSDTTSLSVGPSRRPQGRTRPDPALDD